jgi:hypothetical protein
VARAVIEGLPEELDQKLRIVDNCFEELTLDRATVRRLSVASA